MAVNQIRDDQWAKILAFLKKIENIYIGKDLECRRFMEAVAWISGSGAQWRFLPASYGKWNGVYKRLRHLEKTVRICFRRPGHGKFYDRRRNYSCPSMRGRSSQKEGGQAKHTLGRSRGGFATKIHIAVDALGNPLKFLLAGGQESNIDQAESLTDGYVFRALLADKGCDSDIFVAFIQSRNGEAVIPPRKNRKRPRYYGIWIYRERRLIECFINKIKYFRRIFSRFEKLAGRYLAFLHIASTLIWLR